MMSDTEILEVVQAHKEGKKIERTISGLGQRIWMDITSSPCWDFSAYYYRVAPEPRKPREWSVCVTPDNHIIASIHHKEQCRESIIVREVIEDGKQHYCS